MKLLVVGDTHAGGSQFRSVVYDRAVADKIPVILLGDLVDRGDELPQLIDLISDLDDRGLIRAVCCGNHDHKIYRSMIGRNVRLGGDAEKTLNVLSIEPDIAEQYRRIIEKSYLFWKESPANYFVHAALPSRCYNESPILYRDYIEGRVIPKKNLDVCLYGYTTGVTLPNGYPERDDRWISKIPSGAVVYKGHEYEFEDVQFISNDIGGTCVYVDTGCGHPGGKLSAVEIEVT